MSTKMTKLVLAMGAMVMAGGAMAATASAPASAVVIAPIAVSKAANLSFGNFAPGSGGTVTVNTDGTRTGSGVILSAVNGTALGAAKFDVTGTGAATYSVAYTGSSVSLASTETPEDTMVYAMCSALTPAATCSGTVSTGTLTSGAQSIYVGGTLTVGATQAVHADYTGTVAVVVEYN